MCSLAPHSLTFSCYYGLKRFVTFITVLVIVFQHEEMHKKANALFIVDNSYLTLKVLS